jgi:hypothetical protein
MQITGASTNGVHYKGILDLSNTAGETPHMPDKKLMEGLKAAVRRRSTATVAARSAPRSAPPRSTSNSSTRCEHTTTEYAPSSMPGCGLG